MIGHAVFYGIALTCTCVIVSGTILEPLKNDPSMSELYKNNPSKYNEFVGYLLMKKGGQSQETQESPDSKERRSQMGSSFIRFGRDHFESNLENIDHLMRYSRSNDANHNQPKPTTKRPRLFGGNYVRFGRSALKNSRSAGAYQKLITRADLNSPKNVAPDRGDNYIRFGRSTLKNSRGLGADQQLITSADFNKLFGYRENNNDDKQQLFTGQSGLVGGVYAGDDSQAYFHSSNDLDRVTECLKILADNNYLSDADSINANDPTFNIGKFIRLCNSLEFRNEENDDINERKSKIIEILEDPPQSESNKRE